MYYKIEELYSWSTISDTVSSHTPPRRTRTLDLIQRKVDRMAEASTNGNKVVAAPRTPQSKRLMAEMLPAASRLMSEKGFHGTTVEDLVAAIGLPKGTLYYHIGSKGELLYRIHEQVTEEAFARWLAVLEETKGQLAEHVLDRLIHVHFGMIHEYRDWLAVFSEAMRFLSPGLQSVIQSRRDEYQDLLKDVLEQGIQDRSFTEGSARMRSLIILGTLNSVYRWYRPGGRLGPEALAGIASSIVLDGISTRGGQPFA